MFQEYLGFRMEKKQEPNDACSKNNIRPKEDTFIIRSYQFLSSVLD